MTFQHEDVRRGLQQLEQNRHDAIHVELRVKDGYQAESVCSPRSDRVATVIGKKEALVLRPLPVRVPVCGTDQAIVDNARVAAPEGGIEFFPRSREDWFIVHFAHC